MTRLIITATKYFIIGHTKTQEFFTFHSCLDKFSSEWALGLGKHIFHAEMRFNGYRSLIREGTRKHSFRLSLLAFDEWVDGTHRLAVLSCGPGKGTFLMLPGGRGPNVKGAVESEPNTEHNGPITRSAITPLCLLAFHLRSRCSNFCELILSQTQLNKKKQLWVHVKTRAVNRLKKKNCTFL